MRALITGAGGFVGRWLVAALQDEGAAVHALALEGPAVPSAQGAGASAHGAAVPGAPAARRLGPPVQWHVGDLRDAAYVRAAVRTACPDLVVHLAGISHLPTAAAQPAMAWDVNVTATARLLQEVEALRAAGACEPTVLVVGSAEQYGRHDAGTAPIAEETPQAPRTVYAATKAAQELLALQRWRETGLRVVVARSFNHSGPGQEPRFLLPALVARALALRGAPAGTPLPVGNLTPVRDFLHVSDVVAAYISLGRLGVPGTAYNVASGVGRSVGDVVAQVLARAGVSAPLQPEPSLVRPVDVPALVGDARRLRDATGWRPTRSFDDIIDDLLHAATH